MGLRCVAKLLFCLFITMHYKLVEEAARLSIVRPTLFGLFNLFVEMLMCVLVGVAVVVVIGCEARSDVDQG